MNVHNNTQLTNFPTEVLVNIFHHLPHLSQIFEMREVCYRFKNIIDEKIIEFDTKDRRIFVAEKLSPFYQDLVNISLPSIYALTIDRIPIPTPIEKQRPCIDELISRVNQESNAESIEFLVKKMNLLELFNTYKFMTSFEGRKTIDIIRSIIRITETAATQYAPAIIKKHYLDG